MCSHSCTGRRAVGREHSPEELQCWSYGCWMPHYLLPVCLEASDPLTDGGGDGELCQFILRGVRDDGVKSGAEVYKWRFSTAWYGTVRYGTVHFWGVFHWVLYLVTDTFLVPLRSRFQASRTVTKTWRVNSADHWLAGENRHYCITELATRDPPLQPYPLDLNQHSQRRIGRNFCLNKRTFLHQPQNSSVVVCWGSSDVPLVDSRGADPARAWWHDAEGKSLMYNVTFELAIFTEYVFCLYFYLCICVLLQLKTIWSNKCTSRLY